MQTQVLRSCSQLSNSIRQRSLSLGKPVRPSIPAPHLTQRHQRRIHHEEYRVTAGLGNELPSTRRTALDFERW
ncbi:hypothetical protein C8Q70DRAFT_593740 [Cubamyces menziesii]|nr:hypothetical protein C8Q70DRAFT_593740 [Cubamyces menziesii]